MTKIEYRTPGLPSGVFNRMGTAHVHIDGARSQDLVIRIVKELESRGNPGKLNHVTDFTDGQQRSELPEVYELHTPANETGEETLEFFSTNLVKDRTDAIEVVNLIGTMLRGVRGAIVEMEQVVGWCERDKWEWLRESEHIPTIQLHEVRFKPQPTWPFEIHHGFNVPRGSSVPPVSLPRLTRYCRQNKLVVGGWFVFDKGNSWAYRSNSFTQSGEVRRLVGLEQAHLRNFLCEEGIEATPRTLVEKVVGIWHSQER